ncbi:MAG: undecaprenyldiphospho-muramoylpentapeptide beta-N-acetylglucosaminyltransferase [Desulfarculaceae bacterium]|jgi:UDP-N-acetylglucosamine--N-acetylmuramyl-(pentapeptide) pyrophosphoryl-undecaprenol N-acetylglucosamine transferase
MSGCLLIAGGGTGGHLFPALAVAKVLRRLRPELKVAFVGTGKPLETRVLGKEGFTLERLMVKAFRGQGLRRRLGSLAVLPGSIWQARRLLGRYRPQLVLAVGGYAAFPLGMAAWISGVPLAVQEQNASPGLTNRCLGRLATAVFTPNQAAEAFFSPKKVRLTGNPVRPEIMEQAQAAAGERDDPKRRFHLLVLGGSQGAHSINQALIQALPLLAERKDRLFITHQTGEAEEQEVRRAYEEAGFSVQVSAFVEDMGRAYALAHLVLCRAGAGTISELTALGRAAVCVPYPYAAGDHQTLNARALVEAEAARLIPDRDFDGPQAAAAIGQLMDDLERLKAMETRALALGRPLAADDIAGRCLALMNGRA